MSDTERVKDLLALAEAELGPTPDVIHALHRVIDAVGLLVGHDPDAEW